MERSHAEGGGRPSNVILSKLPGGEFSRLAPFLRSAAMLAGDRLIPVGTEPADVFFVDDGMASMVTMLEDGNALEVAAVGAEGIVGVELVLRGRAMPTVEVIGQVPGTATAISVAELSAALSDCPVLYGRLVRYQSLLLSVAFQSAACASQHPISSRLARWLLTVADRVGRQQFELTHEFIAQMLGVQRSSVTIEARSLAVADLIDYRRGRITITDRAGLEDTACKCYGVVEDEYRKFATMA